MILDCILCDVHFIEVYYAFLLPVGEQEIFAHLYTQFALQGALLEEHTVEVYCLIRLP
jgi:hypothetical protein